MYKLVNLKKTTQLYHITFKIIVLFDYDGGTEKLKNIY